MIRRKISKALRAAASLLEATATSKRSPGRAPLLGDRIQLDDGRVGECVGLEERFGDTLSVRVELGVVDGVVRVRDTVWPINCRVVEVEQ